MSHYGTSAFGTSHFGTRRPLVQISLKFHLNFSGILSNFLENSPGANGSGNRRTTFGCQDLSSATFHWQLEIAHPLWLRKNFSLLMALELSGGLAHWPLVWILLEKAIGPLVGSGVCEPLAIGLGFSPAIGHKRAHPL